MNKWSLEVGNPNFISYSMIRCKILDDSVNIIFLSPKVKYSIHTVSINNFAYAKDTIIVIDSSVNIPMFEKLCNICLPIIKSYFNT